MAIAGTPWINASTLLVLFHVTTHLASSNDWAILRLSMNRFGMP
jgi:hypothetical protein